MDVAMVMDRGTGAHVVSPVAAQMALCHDPETGSTPGCHRHQMKGITTRRLPRGSDFITHDT